MPYYGLRACKKDMTSYGGFKWKKRGKVVAPDWSPSNTHGKGLHAFLNGEGDGSLAYWDSEAYWLVVKFDIYVDLGGKVKFPECTVLFASQDRIKAIAFLKTKTKTQAVIGDHLVVGDYGTATAGTRGKAIAGNHGTATAGYRGKATAGSEGKATAGDHGTATAGDYGTATAGNEGKAAAGNHGTATAGVGGKAIAGNYGAATTGDCGTAIAGARGKAIAGNYGAATTGDCGTAIAGARGKAIAGSEGKATAGDRGTAIAGYRGKATAGNYGTIQIAYSSGGRWRIKTGYIGEEGLKPNTLYELDLQFNFKEAEEK